MYILKCLLEANRIDFDVKYNHVFSSVGKYVDEYYYIVLSLTACTFNVEKPMITEYVYMHVLWMQCMRVLM